MIVLDTNVVSEMMLARRDPAVVAWLDAQQPDAIWTTAVTVFEICHGLAILPAGKKQRALPPPSSRPCKTTWADAC